MIRRSLLSKRRAILRQKAACRTLPLAQAERHRILERTNEGRIEAKSKGIKFGRKRTIDRGKIAALYTSGIGATKIASQEKIGRSTIYKLLKDEAIKSLNHLPDVSTHP